MSNYIIIDLETRDFDIKKGAIYQVGLVATDESFNILESKEISIVEDETQIAKGYGYGYKNISDNEECKNEFNDFINQYTDVKLIAHNSSFDKKFLVYNQWLLEDTIVLDSITMIRHEIDLESYALDYLIKEFDIEVTNRHMAIDDCLAVAKDLNIVNAKEYTPRPKSSSNSTPKELVDNMTEIKELGSNEIVENILANDVICFTGKGKFDRRYLTELANKNGNEVKKSITKAVTLLVVGDLTVKSSKITKAEENGIKVMSADDFVKCFE